MLEGLVDEESAFLGPVQVGIGLASLFVVAEGLGLGIAGLSVGGVEEPAARLLKLHTQLMEQLVELAGREPVVLGDLGGGQQALGLEHHVVVGDLRTCLEQQLGLLEVLCRKGFVAFLFLHVGLQDGEKSLRIREDLLDHPVGDVQAMLADRGQNLVDDPGFELACGGQLAADDQSVEVALIDEREFLGATRGFKGGSVSRPPCSGA